MKFSAVRRITREDLKGATVPGWMDTVLSFINQLSEQINLLVNQNITFSENIASIEITQNFIHGVEKEINPNSSRRVKGCLPLDGGGEAISGIKRITKSNGNQLITVYFQGGVSSTEAKVRLALLVE